MIRFCLLGSGSSGNAILLDNGHSKLLIDNGLSYRQLCARAVLAQLDLHDLAGVLVTHEHGDHVNGIGTLARKHDVPVYLSRGTYEALPPRLGALPKPYVFDAGATWDLAGFRIESYSVTHDAADPVGYAVSAGGAKVGFAFDLGAVTQLVRARMTGAHALVLETNYCPDMLYDGDYPPQVKQRIHGRFGHLSNDDAADLLRDVLHPALQTVVLVHVSENNNTPAQAQAVVRRALGSHPAALHLAEQHAPTPTFEVRHEAARLSA
ncbi:MAG: MBL fold metallo-hydrolase [Candidatus Hydrogenedens sp.]|nr:MBL fold metallo-hydrolase [Candidatus Hydrogenedens sp.]